jgi:uncharacterized protein with FMN-binding domain
MSRVFLRIKKTVPTFAALLAVLGLALTAASFLPLGLTVSLAFSSLLIRRTTMHIVILVSLVLGCLAFRFGVNAEQTPGQTVQIGTPGQYSARSEDLLQLVSVRAVVQPGVSGNVLVFIEANTLPFSGLDRDTLRREVYRTLEAQGLPAAMDTDSDPVTARLYYSALAAAMHPQQQPEPVECPKGVSAPDNFWKMYPSEFSHTCTVTNVPDGQYWGQSTAKIPVSAKLTVLDGRIKEVYFKGPISPYGLKATQAMQSRMKNSQTVGVDIISGATQTAYAVRSAANAACESAKQLVIRNSRHPTPAD